MRAFLAVAIENHSVFFRRRCRFPLPTFLLATTAVLASSRNFQMVSSLSAASVVGTTVAASVPTMNNMNVIAIEGSKASSTSMGSKDFLLQNPSGAYTTARTCCDGTRIFEWDAHIQRTSSSLQSMIETSSSSSSSSSQLTNPIVLQHRLNASVKEAVRLYKEINNKNKNDDHHSQSQELKITALVGWNKKKKKKTTTDLENNEHCDKHYNGQFEKQDEEQVAEDWVACHVMSLPPLPTRPVRVEVRGSPRENANAKDSSWVSDRAPLEKLMSQSTVGPINELLLTNEQTHEILEGSQTNFYAIVNGKLHTADDGILKGTVRTLILDICEKEKIPIVLRPPTLDDIDQWEGALISSTSRLALPIDEVYIPSVNMPSQSTNVCKKFHNDDHNDDDDNDDDSSTATANDNASVANKIQKLVAMEVEARSTLI